MTRETKIGLLVGLAFIIVVGILLSEHLTSTTERPAAALAEAGGTVAGGVATPGVGNLPVARLSEPAAPVPTARELTPAAPTRVEIGAAQPQGAPFVIERRDPIPQAPVQNDPPVVTQLPDPFANQIDPRFAVAQQMGQPLIPADPQPQQRTEPAPMLAANRVREYKAQPGDTLSRIASLLPGGNTKTNREAVMALNPALKNDPNKVIAGRTYMLPLDKPAPAPVPAPLVDRPSPVQPAPASAGQRTYIVKKGDTLTQIAQRECGTVKALPAIRELNKIENDNLIRIDMKLLLPPAQVASGE